MEVLPDHPVLKLSWADVEAVRKECNMTDLKYIQQGIAHVQTWFKQQTHFTKDTIEPTFIERVFLLSQGSIERAKQKVDAIATVRGALEEFYTNRDVDCEDFRRLEKIVRVVALPVANTDLTRVILIRMGTKDVEPGVYFDPLVFYRFLLLMNDNRMFIDYVIGDTYIIDMQHFKLTDFANVSIGLLKKVQVITSAYSIKLKGIHFVNAPSYIDKVIFILKQGLKEKIANRFQVHSSYEELQKYVPRKCLPSDYGGELSSLEELHDEWLTFLRTEESRSFANEANAMKTDETVRSGGKIDEELLGIPGSFRTLSVD